MTTSDGEPVAYDPADAALALDPYPTYGRLREEAPVYRDPDGRFWALCAADVRAAFADSGSFTSIHGVAYEGSGDVPSLLEMDPPVHTAYRQLLARHFAPRAAAAAEGAIRELVRDQVSRLDGRGFDLIDDYAATVPITVAAWLLGIPIDDVPSLRGLVDRVLLGEGDDGESAMQSLSSFVDDLVAGRRDSPRTTS